MLKKKEYKGKTRTRALKRLSELTEKASFLVGSSMCNKQWKT